LSNNNAEMGRERNWNDSIFTCLSRSRKQNQPFLPWLEATSSSQSDKQDQAITPPCSSF
jgi:hypothetical protein